MRKVSARLSCVVSTGHHSIGYAGKIHAEHEIGTLRLRQINFARSKTDWRMLIDLDDDEVQITCNPIVEEGNRFSREFKETVGHEPKTVIVIEKVGLYKEHRGKNRLPQILDVIRSLCPGSAIILSPRPLQHSSEEENLNIMGIKKRAPEASMDKDMLKLIGHYEMHGFRRVGKSNTWALDERASGRHNPAG